MAPASAPKDSLGISRQDLRTQTKPFLSINVSTEGLRDGTFNDKNVLRLTLVREIERNRRKCCTRHQQNVFCPVRKILFL